MNVEERVVVQLRVLLVGIALLVLAGPALPAVADGRYPPQDVHVVQGRVSEPVVERGQAVRLIAGGYQPGTEVRVEVRGELVQVLTADGAGAVVAPVRARALGDQLVAATGMDRTGRLRVVSASVRVLPPGSRSLADGASRSRDVLPGLARGLAVVVLGALGAAGLRSVRRQPVPGS